MAIRLATEMAEEEEKEKADQYMKDWVTEKDDDDDFLKDYFLDDNENE